MPNRWIADGDSYITFPDPGDIRAAISSGSGFKVTHKDVNIQLPTTGYISCKAGTSNKEYGLYIGSDGNLSLVLGNTDVDLGLASTLFGTDIVGELILDIPDADNYTITLDGSIIITGDPVLGGSSYSGILFRVGARGDSNTPGDTTGGFHLDSGDKVGDVIVEIGGVVELSSTMPIAGTNVPATGGDGTLRDATGTTDTDWESLGSGVPAPPAGYSQIAYDGSGSSLDPATTESLFESFQTDSDIGNYTLLINDVIEYETTAGVEVRPNSTMAGTPGTYVITMRVYRVATSDYSGYSSVTINAESIIDTTMGVVGLVRDIVRNLITNSVK